MRPHAAMREQVQRRVFQPPVRPFAVALAGELPRAASERVRAVIDRR